MIDWWKQNIAWRFARQAPMAAERTPECPIIPFIGPNYPIRNTPCPRSFPPRAPPSPRFPSRLASSPAGRWKMAPSRRCTMRAARPPSPAASSPRCSGHVRTARQPAPAMPRPSRSCSVADCDPESGPILCPVRKGANGRPRTGAGMTAPALVKRLARRATQAGIGQCSPHDLRRSFVSAALEGGPISRWCNGSPAMRRRAGRVNESARNIPPPGRHRFPRLRLFHPSCVPPLSSHFPIGRSGRWHRREPPVRRVS